MKTILKNISRKTMEWLSGFYNWLKSDFKNILIFVFVVLAIIFFFLYRNYSRKYSETVNENISLRSSMTEYRNKYNESYAMTQAYITDIKNLKLLNKQLYDEAKSIKDNPVVITKVEYITRVDSIVIRSEVEQKDSTVFVNPIRYRDEWCSIDGTNTVNLHTMNAVTMMDSISFYEDLTLDLIDKNDSLYIVGKSNNPFSRINKIESVVLSPEKSKALKKRFNKPWGVMIGVGGTVSVYQGKVVVLPGINITIGYKFLSF